MRLRTYILGAMLASALPASALAGSGGPVTYTILGLIVVIIIMLGAVLKKLP